MRIAYFAAVAALLIAAPAIADEAAKGQQPSRMTIENSIPVPGSIQVDVRKEDPFERDRERLFQKIAPELFVDKEKEEAVPIPAGLVNAPLVPASVETPPPPASEPVKASATGAMPGVPAPVFTTLAAAAKAGVDPLQERVAKPVEAATPVPPAQPASFAWSSPGAYLDFVTRHQSLFVQGALGLLAGVLVLWLLRRRRA